MSAATCTSRAHCSLGLLALASLFGVGCVPDFDEDLSVIQGPRLLAVAAAPAEAEEGSNVQLEALVATAEGDTPPQPRFTLCLTRKPLTELGPVSPECFQPDDGTHLKVQDLGAGTSVSAQLPVAACKLFGPERPPAMGDDPGGRPVDPDVTGGFYQPFAVRLAQGLTLGSVRLDCGLAAANRDQAIAYRQAYRANEAPRIAELSANAAGAFEALSEDANVVTPFSTDASLVLRARWNECPSESTCGDGLCTAGEDRVTCPDDCETPRGCSGSEPYVWYNAETQQVEPRREGVSVAWYASRGHFENEQTGLDESEAALVSETQNTWLAPHEPGPVTIWAVIRDSRGGQSWRIQHLEVTP